MKVFFFFSSPAFSILLFIATIGILIALIVKKQETPTNFYLLLAFVRTPVDKILKFAKAVALVSLPFDP